MNIIIWELVISDEETPWTDERHYFLFRSRLDKFLIKNQDKICGRNVTIGGIELWLW